MKRSDKAGDSSAISVKLFTSPREVSDDDLRGSAVVVIDVLRASGSIATALANGAREVIPVLTPAEAGELASKSGRGMCLLCGEREGRKIDGFDLGNSPAEYAAEKVGGRILIFASTNGAGAILRARGAERIYIGCFNNFNATMKRLAQDNLPVVILCAGNNDQFSLEDFVCGGKYINSIESRLRKNVHLNDAARAAALMHRHFDGSFHDLLRSTSHGKYLASLGYDADLEHCSQLDSQPVAAQWVEGKIKGFHIDGRPYSEPANV